MGRKRGIGIIEQRKEGRGCDAETTRNRDGEEEFADNSRAFRSTPGVNLGNSCRGIISPTLSREGRERHEGRRVVSGRLLARDDCGEGGGGGNGTSIGIARRNIP